MLSKLVSLLEPKQAHDQAKSEAIVALCTLLYQSDAKVKLEEQDLFSQVLADLPWQNPACTKDAYHHRMVTEAIEAFDNETVADYLAKVVPVLKSDAETLALLRELAMADGEMAPQEESIIKAVSDLMAS